MDNANEVCTIQGLAMAGRSAVTTIFIITLAFGVLGMLWIIAKRRFTKFQLEQRGIPTVMWRPKFVRYLPLEEDKKLSSSTITRILPRMERLGGPFGIYGTVYGIDTPVIHVAHPIPVGAIFGTNAIGCISSSHPVSTVGSKRRYSSVAYSTGASKSPAYNHFKNFCGEGVFTADGDDWKAKRASLMHCLIRGTTSSSSDVSKRLENEANHAADTFLAQIRQLQDAQKHSNIVTNVVPLLQRATAGLIYRYITHHEPRWSTFIPPKNDNDDAAETISLSSSDSSLTSSDHDNAENEKSGTCLVDQYLKSIVRIRMIILAQSRSIWFVLPRVFYSTFSSLYRDEEETLGPIREFSEQACRCAQPGSPLARLQSSGTHGKPTPGTQFSKDLLDEAITLLFAGQDTSAATLSWTIHLLSIYPAAQTRLANELRSAICIEGNEVAKSLKVSRTIFSKLPFLDAVIKESMRLYPVAPFVVRQLQSEITVEDPENPGPKVTLPAGSTACIWIYSLHRNPALWDRPGEFIPDRWLREEKDLGQTSGAYIPFATGPRNCVGQPIAHVVLRTLLARLVLALEFRDERLGRTQNPDELQIEMQAGFTVLPSGGVTVAIAPRTF